MRIRPAAGALAALLAAAAAFPQALAGQSGSRVSGRVLDAGTERPVEAAEVVLADLGRRAATDRRGGFAFEEVPPGTHTLRVHHLGYASGEWTIDVPEAHGLGLTIRVEPAPLALEPLTVEIETELRVPYLERRGFYHRRDMGFGGTFFDPEYMTRWSGMRIPQLVARAPFNRHQASGCAARVYVDGQRWGTELPDIPASEIAAVEVYRGPAQAAGVDVGVDPCGSVLLWTWRGPNPFHHR